MNSLMKLNVYNESDSEEENNTEMSRLPLPGFIGSTPSNKSESLKVDVDGKVRNFPHEPGIWATYIYIPVDSYELSSYADDLLNFFKPLNLKVGDDFHISLTRTVILRHHWIPDFVGSIKNCLRETSQFRIHLSGLKAYMNEQNTRTFVSLKVNEGEDSLKSVINVLNDCFKDYNLQGFYEDPSFHISLLWCPGNKFSEVKKYIDMLPVVLANFEFYQKVSHCICATGNKRFTFHFD